MRRHPVPTLLFFSYCLTKTCPRWRKTNSSIQSGRGCHPSPGPDLHLGVQDRGTEWNCAELTLLPTPVMIGLAPPPRRRACTDSSTFSIWRTYIFTLIPLLTSAIAEIRKRKLAVPDTFPYVCRVTYHLALACSPKHTEDSGCGIRWHLSKPTFAVRGFYPSWLHRVSSCLRDIFCVLVVHDS